MQATPKRTSSTIQPPLMFGKSYKPPRGKFAGALIMFAVVLVLFSAATTLQVKQTKAETPRAVLFPKDRPLVIAVATFTQDLPNKELHWMRYAFTEALAHNLSALTNVRVIEREFVLRAEAQLQNEQDAGIFAGALGADLVLSGEVWQQEEGRVGVTVRALSPVNIFFAEEVAAEKDFFSLPALMAGNIAGKKLTGHWAPSNLAMYQEYLTLKYSPPTEENKLAQSKTVEAAYSAMLQREPAFTEALFERAKHRLLLSMWLFDEAKRAEACQDLQAAQKLSSRGGIASLLMECDVEASLAVLQQDKSNVHARVKLADTLLRYGLLDDARSLLDAVVKDDDSAGPAWLMLSALALLRDDEKALFFARHALQIEEQLRATPHNHRSFFRGWRPPTGGRLYVTLADQKTISKEEREKLLREEDGLYLKGGSLFNEDELFLRAMLKGQLPESFTLRSPLLTIFFPERSVTPQNDWMRGLQAATVLMLQGKKEEAARSIELLASAPKTKLEEKLISRWRDVWLSDNPPSATSDWLQTSENDLIQ